MIKRMTMLRRRPDLSREEFFSHWEGQHAQFALSLPGVVKYLQNRISRKIREVGVLPNFQVDGIVELYFSDEATMKLAQASAVGSKSIPADELNFLSGWTLCLVDSEGPQEISGGVKVMVALVAKPERQADVFALFRKAISDEGAKALGYSLNISRQSLKREALWQEPHPPTAFVNLWYSSEQAAAESFENNVEIKAAMALCEVVAAYMIDIVVKR